MVGDSGKRLSRLSPHLPTSQSDSGNCRNELRAVRNALRHDLGYNAKAFVINNPQKLQLARVLEVRLLWPQVRLICENGVTWLLLQQFGEAILCLMDCLQC